MGQDLEILRSIKGGQELVDWLGYREYPYGILHDGEIIELCLHRLEGSRLVIQGLKYEDATLNSRIVTFYLKDVMNVNLEGFLNQNVVGSVLISPAEVRELHGSLLGIGARNPDHQIAIEPCAGAFGLIRATIIEIELGSVSSLKA
ncbi:MAG: hypothetical protein ABIN69_12555 [Aestuariivirga sp.]